MSQIITLERQIAAIKRNIFLGKAKNMFAAEQKVSNLIAQLAATKKAYYISDWLSQYT
jgi:hypothetical protein